MRGSAATETHALMPTATNTENTVCDQSLRQQSLARSLVNIMVEQSFRPLFKHERELIEKLLEPEFAGRDELRAQLQTVTARQLLADGTFLELRCDSDVRAPVRNRVPTEGTCQDTDGGTIDVFLHVVDGLMHELEILKYDGPIREWPTAENLTV